jgi:hypothetical protein
MSILSPNLALDDALYSLQADRFRLASIAAALQEPISDNEAAQFVALSEHVDHEMESLAYRLAAKQSK